MKVLFETYDRRDAIPVQDYLRNKKLAKYFNREAAAAVVCATKLLNGSRIDSATPFYYDTGRMEFEDYGLDSIVSASLDGKGGFSQRLFVDRGVKAVMPLTQFKALYNMPLCLVSIEHGLTGDNAALYGSARGLLTAALHAPRERGILLGAGKLRPDGGVESGFALIDKEEIRVSRFLTGNPDAEGIELFRSWHAARACS
jgi:hypothetical protein